MANADTPGSKSTAERLLTLEHGQSRLEEKFNDLKGVVVEGFARIEARQMVSPSDLKNALNEHFIQCSAKTPAAPVNNSNLDVGALVKWIAAILTAMGIGAGGMFLGK